MVRALAKAGQDVTVYGEDKTAMHYAHLQNYLGAPDVAGSELQRIGRAQVSGFGGAIIAAAVTAIVATSDAFAVTLGDGTTADADYLILSEGRNRVLARTLELTEESGAIVTDREGRSSNDRVYVVGRAAGPERSQAIISAGAGAVAALDILSREQGSDYQDWDSPAK